MIAAIYARKSTEQTGMADEQKSVTRQIDHARQYAHRKGWTVDEATIFVDDGISGAEFATRPGFLRLMNALKPRPAFQVLVMSEESRLGREAIETAYALKQLVQAGVRVFFYLEDRERTLDSPTDKIMMSLTAFADELEREKARQRTYDAMARKAKAGHVTGGRVFGYDNVDVCGAAGGRSHVMRRINEPEAAVVRQIFELCAAGAGLTRITKTLNQDRVPAPRAQQGRPTGWAGSSVRSVLLRRLYAGEIVWNQTRKRDRWGLSNRADRTVGEWVRVSAPELRVISPELWAAAHAQFAERQQKHTGIGRRRLDVESNYLLSGFARCGTCGGGLGVHTRQHGGQRVPFYGCAAYWKRGLNVCANNLLVRMDTLDTEVLATLQDDVFRPAVIEEAIRLALEELSPATQDRNREKIVMELAQVRQECDRLAEAIGGGGPLDALVARLTAREARCVALEQELAYRPADRPVMTLPALEARLRAKLGDWRALLARNVQEGRAVLRALLIGPLKFTPVNEPRRRGYAFEGQVALDRLLAGVVELPPLMASPAGFEPAFWP
ncbi:MAG: recombinase family protein [Acidobacteriota bacterium]